MADPGFSVWGHRPHVGAFFGGNVCENKRIRSRWGSRASGAPWIHHCQGYNTNKISAWYLNSILELFLTLYKIH